jgi:hypothetical protein
MALFGFGKEKREVGVPDLVMAYLEDAHRVRSPFLLKDGRKVEHPGTLQALDEEAGTFNLQVSGSFAGEKGSKAELVFIHENLRLGANTRVAEIRGGTVVLELPEELVLLERRKQPRARLNPKEGATLTGLTSLFEGVGITGVLESLSEGGCRVRVEKAMNIKDQKKLGIGTALLPVGHSFMILKLNKVPRCPSVMEMAGKVAYLDDSAGGLVLGLSFEKSEFSGAIRNLVSSRAGSIPSSVPSKARRRTVLDEPEEVPAHRPERTEKTAVAQAPPKPVEAIQPEVPVPPPPQAPAPPAVQAPRPAPEPEACASSHNNPLLRLKKRSRAVIVLAQAGPGELLRGHLLEEGYGRVLVALGWDEVVAHLHESGVGLLLIDTPTPLLESMEMVQRLRDAGMAMPSVVLAADEVSRALVVAAQRCGISHLLVKPYALDDALSLLLEQQMGLA